MADTVTTRWLYPPNWDGFVEPRGYLRNGWKHMVVQLTCSSDATGETAVRKVTRGDLYGPSGLPCKRIGIDEVIYHVYGMDIHLYYDMDPIETIVRIPSDMTGTIKGPFYPGIPKNEDYGPGETGDIMLTSGIWYDGSYDIILKLRIKET